MTWHSRGPFWIGQADDASAWLFVTASPPGDGTALVRIPAGTLFEAPVEARADSEHGAPGTGSQVDFRLAEPSGGLPAGTVIRMPDLAGLIVPVGQHWDHPVGPWAHAPRAPRDVAIELNNLRTALVGFRELIASRPEPGDEDEMRDAGERLVFAVREAAAIGLVEAGALGAMLGDDNAAARAAIGSLLRPCDPPCERCHPSVTVQAGTAPAPPVPHGVGDEASVPAATAARFAQAIEPVLDAAAASITSAGSTSKARTWTRGGGAIGCLWALPETLRVRAWVNGNGGIVEADILTNNDSDRWAAAGEQFATPEALAARGAELAVEGSARLAEIARRRAGPQRSR